MSMCLCVSVSVSVYVYASVCVCARMCLFVCVPACLSVQCLCVCVWLWFSNLVSLCVFFQLHLNLSLQGLDGLELLGLNGCICIEQENVAQRHRIHAGEYESVSECAYLPPSFLPLSFLAPPLSFSFLPLLSQPLNLTLFLSLHCPLLDGGTDNHVREVEEQDWALSKAICPSHPLDLKTPAT